MQIGQTVLKQLSIARAAWPILTLSAAMLTGCSPSAARYECIGETTLAGETEAETIYIELEKYPWWARLWSASYGALYIEHPNRFVDNFTHLEEVGAQLQVFDYDGTLKGNFSTISRALALDTSIGFFDGACHPLSH